MVCDKKYHENGQYQGLSNYKWTIPTQQVCEIKAKSGLASKGQCASFGQYLLSQLHLLFPHLKNKHDLRIMYRAVQEQHLHKQDDLTHHVVT
jgi:hypothetical protein